LPEFGDLILKLTEKKNQIDSAIEEYIKKRYSDEIYDLVKYAVIDGKRLRGIVLLLTSEALEGDYEKAMKLAISAELGHAASLVHDDIIDKSVERRRKPTLWKKYGIEKAVILPHILISESLDIARKEGEKFFRVVLRHGQKPLYGGIILIIIC
jgi:Geranylgeranyl pyrophosphate synthase